MLLSNFTFSINYSHALLFENKLQNECRIFLSTLKGLQNFEFYRIKTDENTGGVSIAVQLHFLDQEALDLFNQHNLQDFFSLFVDFKGEIAFFNSLLEKL